MPGSSELANENNVIMVPEDGIAVDVSVANQTFVQPVVLYVGTGGDVEVVTKKGTTLIFKNVPDGFQLAIKVSQVNTAGTTATDILGLW